MAVAKRYSSSGSRVVAPGSRVPGGIRGAKLLCFRARPQVADRGIPPFRRLVVNKSHGRISDRGQAAVASPGRGGFWVGRLSPYKVPHLLDDDAMTKPVWPAIRSLTSHFTGSGTWARWAPWMAGPHPKGV